MPDRGYDPDSFRRTDYRRKQPVQSWNMPATLRITLLCLLPLVLGACSTTTTHPSIQQKYSRKLAQLEPGMSPAEVRSLLPIRKQGASSGDKETYVLRDAAGLHQTFQDKTPSIFGIRAEELPEMRQMSFYFKDGSLTHWDQ